MSKPFIKWKRDYTLLAGLENRVNQLAPEAARAVMQTIRRDIYQTVTARQYPPASEYGEPPAMREGGLAQAVRSAPIEVGSGGRSMVSGRFVGADTHTAVMKIDTRPHNDRRRRYAQALEDENYLNRQFVQPAMERGTVLLADAVKRVFQKGFKYKSTGQMWDGRKWTSIEDND